jgi:(E)-4-hydroxy-3-methylbut-2-enyl-diphosphate synthase
MGFHNFVFSMKSSNPKVMVECYRLLSDRLAGLGPDWNYPLHLGVTEAGEGEDGRIKSAIGIGALLADGIGDTIRVSLTEDSPREIAVCNELLVLMPSLSHRPASTPLPEQPVPWDPFNYKRRLSAESALPSGLLGGGEQTVRVVVTRPVFDAVAPRISPKADVRPEAVMEDLNLMEIDPRQPIAPDQIPCDSQWVTVADEVPLPPVTAFRLLVVQLRKAGRANPILLKDTLYPGLLALAPSAALLQAAVNLGALLADGIGDAILVRGESGPGQSLRLAYNILQAAGCRSFKTDYVACPSCGRTLFDLQTVTARIKKRPDHLKGVKIAIMGCIVNGPGEMADADFGYVGGAPGKINLYVGKNPVRFNIPETEAVDRLVDLIREHGKWAEPEPTGDQVADGVTA